LFADIPILMVTALDDRESMIQGLDAGADDYITKPYDRYELRARLFSITRLNRYRKLLDQQTNLEAAHNQLVTAYDATIEGWSRAMDLRDRETEGRTKRVTEMTLSLARLMKIGDDQLLHIRRGALLHDLGKLGIPDSILHKPGPLTQQEWIIMRTHPQLAVEMLSPIEYLRPSLDIPHYHHEKWDGTGYPYGLKGSEIPSAARMFAVVDVWDALRSNRPYRPAWDQEKTLAYILEQSGKHFEPEVVEAFQEVVKMKLIGSANWVDKCRTNKVLPSTCGKYAEL
jgi:putative two-component system response regulator